MAGQFVRTLGLVQGWVYVPVQDLTGSCKGYCGRRYGLVLTSNEIDFYLKIEFLIIDGNLVVGIRLEGNSPFSKKINNYNYSILLIIILLLNFISFRSSQVPSLIIS